MVVQAPADGGLHPGVGSAGGEKCPEPGCIAETESAACTEASDVRRKRKRGTGEASEFLA